VQCPASLTRVTAAATPEPDDSGALAALVLFQIPVMHHRRIQSPVRLLRRIADLDLREVQSDLFGGDNVTAGSTGLIIGYEQVVEFDLEVLLLVFAGFAAGQKSLFDMLAAGTGQEQLRTGLVHAHHEAEIIHAHLPGPTASARRMRSRV